MSLPWLPRRRTAPPPPPPRRLPRQASPSASMTCECLAKVLTQFSNRTDSGIWKALIGRGFIWGKHDCWSIISDWYLETKNIKLKEWKRPKKIKDFIDNPLFEKGLPITGFKKQPTNDDIQVGDVLLFESVTKNLDHVAVYIGDMMILNHNIKGLSCREPFDLRYQQSLRGVYRYEA